MDAKQEESGPYQDLNTLLAQSGFPANKVALNTWSLVVRTGVLDLTLEVHQLTRQLLVTTRGYLQVPPAHAGRVERTLTDLQWLAGFARFLSVRNRRDQLAAVEVGCMAPLDLLGSAMLRRAITAVSEAAVWYAPLLQSLAAGLPTPPPWPEGQDPAVGLEWGEGNGTKG